MPLENTPCLLCGSSSCSYVMEMHDRLCRLPGVFTLVRCGQCGLTYLSPRPDATSIGAYYPATYDPHQIVRIEDLPLIERLAVQYGMRKRCRVVLRRKPRGKILDVGCATGLFLSEIQKQRGWEACGVEPNEEAAHTARLIHGLDIHVGEVTSAQYLTHSFDVVTLWDVLEHLHDPIAVLQEVRRVLKEDGVLVMRTPSLDSWDARLFGQYWAGLDAPRHLAIFSPETLRTLLRRSGFNVENIGTGTGSYIIFLLSLRFWLDERVKNDARRRRLMRLFDNPLAKGLALLPLALLDRLGRGAAMTVVARPSTKTGAVSS